MLKPQPAERPGAARLLLVDDDELLLKATKRVLKQRGYHVVACSRGDAAIWWLDREAFDVLISDVLPGPGTDLFTMNANGTGFEPILTDRPHVTYADWGTSS